MSLKFLVHLCHPNHGLWQRPQTAIHLPSSWAHLIYVSHHDSWPSLLLGFSLQLLNNPLPTRLTLFCSPNSSDTSNLHSHPSLSHSSSLNRHQSIYSLAWFSCLESSPCWSWHSLFPNPSFCFQYLPLGLIIICFPSNSPWIPFIRSLLSSN